MVDHVIVNLDEEMQAYLDWLMPIVLEADQDLGRPPIQQLATEIVHAAFPAPDPELAMSMVTNFMPFMVEVALGYRESQEDYRMPGGLLQ